MDETPLLKLPYIMAAQAQKHVTHNEAIRSLDALVQLSVLDRDLSVPPGTPVEGSRYIVAAIPTGAWSGQAGRIAAWQDGAWSFHAPREGWLCWIADEAIPLVYTASQWTPLPPGAAPVATLNRSASGATTVLGVLEQELTLSGASVDSTVAIPARAIVLAVSTRTTEAITGASSYDCGIAGEVAKYGGALGIAADSTNSGVTGPTAFYVATPVRITANGGSFAGGKVRIAIHHVLCGAPTA